MTPAASLPVRVLVLHARLSGYFVACLNQLAKRAQIIVVSHPRSKDAPFDGLDIAPNIQLMDRHQLSPDESDRLLKESRPDLILVSGWFDSEYCSICKAARDSGISVVVGVDTLMPNSFVARTRLRSMRSRVRSFANYIWVPGVPHLAVAELLGFTPPARLTGMYSCDSCDFSSLETDSIATRNKFLFVGRFAKVKGISLLVDAYGNYRGQSQDPWDLICIGVGPYRDLLVQQPGIDVRPFVQPRDLPSVFAEASVFVMPSRYEPWGVVIHEAASAGLPLICSDACGAAAHLVQDRFNGLTFSNGDCRELVASLIHLSTINPATHSRWSSNSRLLASQFSPQRWGEHLARCHRAKRSIGG